MGELRCDRMTCLAMRDVNAIMCLELRTFVMLGVSKNRYDWTRLQVEVEHCDNSFKHTLPKCM